MAERSKALRSGRSLSGGVGSNPTSDKNFTEQKSKKLESLGGHRASAFTPVARLARCPYVVKGPWLKG